MSDYKPETVAVATVRGVPNVRVMRTVSDFPTQAPGWFAAEIDGKQGWRWYADETHAVTDVHPLVVIDPEDREQVERLALACIYGLDPDAMQAALREFANPKPAEPTGLGAVVEDAEGVRWVRTNDSDQPWIDAVVRHDWRYFKDITAVRVLSEGVQPC